MRWSLRRSYHLKTLITGLPRCGTSFLTEIVSQFGGNLGKRGAYRTFEESGRRGYNEHLKLNRISDDLLQECQADFHFQLPSRRALSELDTRKAQQKIKATVDQEKIDIYKDNKLVVLADIYYLLYPRAKWIFVHRPVEETHKSRFGEPISFADWQEISRKRMALWQHTAVAVSALYLDFNRFRTDFDGQLKQIADHLELPLTKHVHQRCRQFYTPRKS